MTPLPIGAALLTADIAEHRDWLIAGQRDLEIQDLIFNDVILGDWQARMKAAKAALDGFQGRLGIHGPFYGINIANNDPEIGPLCTKRLMTGLEACVALGADQMVVHSPFTTWDAYNFGNNPASANRPSARQEKFDAVRGVLGPVVDRAANEGVTLVIENIEDIVPADRRELAESLGAAAKVSIDTGHAHYAHRATGAPPVDYFVRDAGDMLAHVHLQDADGFADRHWAPGRGNIEWHGVFAALADLPERPRLVLELRNHRDIPAGFAWLEREGLAC